MSFNHKYNKNDIFNRSIIGGLINFLNNKIFFINELGDDKQDIIQVPFYFRMAGDERMLQDKFLNWDECTSKKLEGNYDKIPKGVVSLTSSSVDTSSITQRFIRGSYTREVNGQLETFSANINPIPYIFSFNIEIKTDTFTDVSKIQQSLIESFFRTNVYNVLFKGFMLSCQFAWPEENSASMETEYTFPADGQQNYVIEIGIEVHTYYPIVDAPGIVPENFKFTAEIDGDAVNYAEQAIISTDQRAGDRNDVNKASNNLFPRNLSTEMHHSDRLKYITHGNIVTDYDNVLILKTPIHDQLYTVGSYIPIVWDTIGSIYHIDILKSVNNSDVWETIVSGIHNSGQYVWKLENTGMTVNITDDNGNDAYITASVDALGGIYKANVINHGRNYTQMTALSVVSRNGTGCILNPVIQNGQIISVDVINAGTGYISTPISTINIKIRNSYNFEVFDMITYDNTPGYIRVE